MYTDEYIKSVSQGAEEFRAEYKINDFYGQGLYDFIVGIRGFFDPNTPEPHKKDLAIVIITEDSFPGDVEFPAQYKDIAVIHMRNVRIELHQSN